jgi:putative ABC transport system permease protein
MKIRPPRLASWLLAISLRRADRRSRSDDFEEIYRAILEEKGPGQARRWYWGEVLGSLPGYLAFQGYWRFVMLRNYLKVAARQMKRHKVYAAINITGLAVGMACTLLLVLWVREELSYDTFHESRKDIYRLVVRGKDFGAVRSPAPFAPAIEAEIPEVREAVRWVPNPRFVLKYGERAFYEDHGISADPSFLKVFTFPLLLGNPETALAAPDSIILTASLARKYYGNENPLGKSLLLEGRRPLSVTGVMADVPRNSHFRFDYILSFAFVEDIGWWGMEWGDFNFMIYLRTRPPLDEASLVRKLNALAEKHGCEPVVLKQLTFSVQRLEKAYLNPVGVYDLPLGNKKYVHLFSAIALLLALIASINFINLTTARAEKRAKEVGLRKVIGADRRQIIGQFFGESMLLTLISLGLAVVLAEIARPSFEALTGKSIGLRLIDPGFLLILAGVAGFVGLLAGALPSFYLASFQPGLALKGRPRTSARRGSLRRILVVAQFAVSIFLILATGVVFRQLRFIRQTSWTPNGDRMVVLPFNENIGSKYDLVRSELLKHPAVTDVAAKDCLPTTSINSTNSVMWPGKTVDQGQIYFDTTRVDMHYFAAMGMDIVAGRGFSDDYPGDVGTAYVVNEEAVRRAGIINPVGSEFALYGRKGTIVGVVKNTIFQSLRQDLRPQVFHLFSNLPRQTFAGAVLVRIKGAADAPLSEIIAHLEKVWRSVNTYAPFEFRFLDQAVEAHYSNERRQGRLFGSFAFLAIFISCLGLFGLASFVAEKKTKEIGIRKTLGASISDIMFLLTREFSTSVLAANLIAWPVAWFVMRRWLENFALRTSISFWLFLAAGAAALAISWLTIGLHTFKSARADPVKALRYE